MDVGWTTRQVLVTPVVAGGATGDDAEAVTPSGHESGVHGAAGFASPRRAAAAAAAGGHEVLAVVALVNTGSGRPFTRRHEQALAAVCFEIEQARARLVASRRVRGVCSPAGSTRLWRRVVCVCRLVMGRRRMCNARGETCACAVSLAAAS